MKGGGRDDNRSGNDEPYHGYSEPLDGAVPRDICQGLRLNSCRLQNTTEALDSVRMGDELEVEEYKSTIVKISTQNGVLCGYIMDGKVSRLAECLAKGNRYKAVVVYKSLAYCDVDIEKG